MELNYKIVFSRRKTLSITVERDRSVVVMAPVGTTPEKIHEVVESRKLWIYEKTRHAQKYNELPHPPGKELVTGESMLYLGRNYRIELMDTESKLIHFDQKFIVPRGMATQGKSEFRRWYKEMAHERILPRVQRFAKSLGVMVNEAKIGDSRFRWGSCTPKDNVTINWRLIKAPVFVIDYVIAHELAHLIENNHTPRFWNIVRAQVPKMEKAKAWLREHGALLEQDL